jgi:hypothetical protein
MTPTDWLADQVKFTRVCGIPGEYCATMAEQVNKDGAPTGFGPGSTLLAPNSHYREGGW